MKEEEASRREAKGRKKKRGRVQRFRNVSRGLASSPRAGGGCGLTPARELFGLISKSWQGSGDRESIEEEGGACRSRE